MSFYKKSIAATLSMLILGSPIFANDQLDREQDLNKTPILSVLNEDGDNIMEAPVDIKEYVNVEKSYSPFATSNDVTEKIVEVESNVDMSILASRDSSHSDYGYDSSGSVKLWGRITYSKDFSGNYRLDRVEGNARVLDSNAVYISSETVVVACRDQIGESSHQNFTFYPSPGAFSRSTGFTKYVNINNPFARCGMSIATKINRKHNNSSWTFFLPVALTDGFQNAEL